MTALTPAKLLLLKYHQWTNPSGTVTSCCNSFEIQNYLSLISISVQRCSAYGSLQKGIHINNLRKYHKNPWSGYKTTAVNTRQSEYYPLCATACQTLLKSQRTIIYSIDFPANHCSRNGDFKQDSLSFLERWLLANNWMTHSFFFDFARSTRGLIHKNICWGGATIGC